MDWQRRNRARRRRRRQGSGFIDASCNAPPPEARRGAFLTAMYRDTLFYAFALTGSERELARQLRVTAAEVEKWLSGANDIPEWIFQRTIDVITASSPQAIGRSRGFLSRTAAPS